MQTKKSNSHLNGVFTCPEKEPNWAQTLKVKHVTPIKIIKVLMQQAQQDQSNQIKGAKRVNSHIVYVLL